MTTELSGLGNLMVGFSFLDAVLSAGVVSTLIATGAFIQKSRDNSTEIISLKQRVMDLEADRPRIAALVAKVEGLDDRLAELKSDMKEGFSDLKTILHSAAAVSGKH